MIEVFADTGYWLALILRRDALHEIAMRVSDTMEFSRIVTSELVLVEFVNHLSNSDPVMRMKAVKLWSIVHVDSIVVPATDLLLQKAMDFYTRHSDKHWSLTDCASFVIMRERKIHDALAFDLHFEQAGFRALLRSEG
jgi:predicted nucleic acid-binding protein